MTDLNPFFNSFLKAHDTQLKTSRRKRSDITDEFLKEAYRINAHISSLHTYLLRIRQPYLSISPSSSSSSHRLSSSSPPLTNPQRDRIDQESKSLLRDLQFSIQQLTAAAALRHDTQLQLIQRKYGAGGGGAAFLLRRWANGGRNPVDGSGGGHEEEKLRTEKTWRESVVWYLGRALEAAGEVQRGMMERRLEREVERSRSVLYMSRASGAGAVPGVGGGGGGGSARKSGGEEAGSGGPLNTSRSPTNINPPTANQTWTQHPTTTTTTTTSAFPPPSFSSSSSPTIEPDLTPSQLQLFAQENQAMLKQYEDTLDQVRTAESSLLEISSLQTSLSTSLTLQSAHIEQLVADAGTISLDVDKGNKELKRAGDRGSVARGVFWATCGLSAGLVLWDLVF